MESKLHILVPVDLSVTSLHAVRAVRAFAFPPAHITLIHVYNPLPSSANYSFKIEPGQQLLFTSIEKRLMKSLLEVRRTELDGIEDVSVELESTALLSTAGVICQFAISNSVDLIVLTTAGRTGLSYVLMGSVAEEIVRRSPCPVLVVRSDNYIKKKTYQWSNHTTGPL